MNRDFLKYLGGLLLFGSNGIVASGILMPSSQLVLVRTLIGCALLGAAVLLVRPARSATKHPRELLLLVVSGIAEGAAWLFLYEAYGEIGVGVTTLVFYCGPVIVMALSPFVFKTRLTAPMLAGFGIVILGMLLVNGNALQGGKTPWGLFCAGMSAVMYAAMIVCNKKAPHVQGLENAAIVLFSTLATVAVFIGATSGFALDPRGQDIPAILFLGLANTGLGALLYFSAVGKLPVQTVSICGYLEPLFAVVLSAAVLGEVFGPPQVLGAVCIIGGAVLGEWASSKAHRTESSPDDETG